jgi:hypothetical protein
MSGDRCPFTGFTPRTQEKIFFIGDVIARLIREKAGEDLVE